MHAVDFTLFEKTFLVFISTRWASNIRQPVLCPSLLQYTIFYEKSAVFSPCPYTSPWSISDWSCQTKKSRFL